MIIGVKNEYNDEMIWDEYNDNYALIGIYEMKIKDNIVIWDVYDEMSFESDDVIDKSLGRFNGVFVKHYSCGNDKSFKIYEPSSMNEEVNNNDHEENTNISISVHKRVCWDA